MLFVDTSPGRQDAPATPVAAHRTADEPLHVCHVISGDLWAGAEKQVATTAAYLSRCAGIRLSAVLFNEGVLAAELRGLGIPVTIVDETRHGTVGMARRLVRHLRDANVDVLHTHRYNDTVLGAAAAFLIGIPAMVRTIHGLREPLAGWSGVKFSAYEWLERAALRLRAGALVAVSAPIARELRSAGFRRDRIVRISNGIDCGRVAAHRPAVLVRRELGIAPGAFVIGTAGRLTPVKGHASLLDAARIVMERRPDAAILLVGDGPLAEALRHRAADLGIAGACVFAGARTDVYDLIGAMDVFALPSLAEGTPMALLEAMSLGVPVVATRVGGVPDVLEGGTAGLLVEPGSDRTLAGALLAVAERPGEARRRALRARRAVARRFSIDRSGQALADTYCRVATAPAGSGAGRILGPCLGAALDVLDRAVRKLHHGVERRRQQRARARLVASPPARVRSARRVLVICHGNIIRSAFAARLLAERLGAASGIDVVSAGLNAEDGRTCHQNALPAAAARGIDLSGHRAVRLHAGQVAAADAIFVMDVPQLVTMRDRFPDAADRTFLLAAFAPGVPLDIADPVLGDAAVFDGCFDHIVRAVEPLVGVLAREGSPV